MCACVCVIISHGAIVCGATVGEALLNMLELVNCCNSQLDMMQAVGGDVSSLIFPTAAVVEETRARGAVVQVRKLASLKSLMVVLSLSWQTITFEIKLSKTGADKRGRLCAREKARTARKIGELEMDSWLRLLDGAGNTPVSFLFFYTHLYFPLPCCVSLRAYLGQRM
eukprot:COSAG06_NODE_149_length_22026_cov_33.454782_4_plen_168_part_00